MRARIVATVLGAALIAPFVTVEHAEAIPGPAPQLRVDVVLSGLTNAWDLAFAPDGTMFVTERPGTIRVRLADATTRALTADLSDLWVSGETGLMGIETDPEFVSNRRLYTCQGTTDVGTGAVDGTSVQVVAWTVDAGYTALTRVADPLVGGIAGSSGRHGGCQLRIDAGGGLRIGTGDAAVGTNPQNRFSLNGKTLRVDRLTGGGLAGNPFFGNPAAGDARVFTFGHRNVQGLALRPGTAEVWSVEHGSDRDDEINRLTTGGNYGWDPVPGYDESTPMTDTTKFPGAITPAWASGFPTIATSGAAFLTGTAWGPLQGTLAVSTLKGESLRFFTFNAAGALVAQATPPELDRTFGRLRGAEMGPCGVLYLTTDAGGGGSRVLAVQPTVTQSGAAAAAVGNGNEVLTRCGPAGDIEVRSGIDGTFAPTWTSIGGVAGSEPDIASWGPGRRDIVVLGTDGAVWHRGFQGPTAFGWESLGGRFTSAPSAVSWGPDRLDVFGRGLDGALWANFWNGTRWRGWYSLGGQLAFGPEAASWGVNRLDIVAPGTDLAMWHLVWDGVRFSGWERLAGRFSSGAGIAAPASNRLQLFGRGTDGAVWTARWTGSVWTGWSTIGGAAASAPDAASTGANTWHVFVLGTDLRLYRTSSTTPGWTLL